MSEYTEESVKFFLLAIEKKEWYNSKLRRGRIAPEMKAFRH